MIETGQQPGALNDTGIVMQEPAPWPAIRWWGDRLELLDQRILPRETVYLSYQDAGEVAEAIAAMVVRGAPAIGITAAYGTVLAARQVSLGSDATGAAWLDAMAPALDALAASRPTAVNLFWALQQARAVIGRGGDVASELEAMAIALHREDLAANHRIGAFGADLMADSVSIYTHCNAGALATGGYGTALGVVRAAAEAGKLHQVYAGETRPWLQGSRLTSWELQRDDIAVALVTEGAAGSLMRQGKVNWVVVGADRVARNGDVANKIGTYNLAVLARHHGVKFMVALPTSTIDMAAADGSQIPIEQRDPGEVTQYAGHAIAPEGVAALNPAFDVTPADLVDAIVTEKGVVERPDEAGIVALMGA